MGWLRRHRDRAHDIERELHFHVEERTDVLVSEGASRTEASRRARAELGGLESVTAQCREVWRPVLLHAVRHGLRCAARMLDKRPAVLSLIRRPTVTTSGPPSPAVSYPSPTRWRDVAQFTAWLLLLMAWSHLHQMRSSMRAWSGSPGLC